MTNCLNVQNPRNATKWMCLITKMDLQIPIPVVTVCTQKEWLNGREMHCNTPKYNREYFSSFMENFTRGTKVVFRA